MTAVSAPRRRNVAIVSIVFVVALVVAAMNDQKLAVDARTAPVRVVDIGQFVTSFGTSAYMFVFSALIAAGAIVAMKRGRTSWRGASLHLIAERAFFFFAAIAASGIMAQLIKHIVGRSRPSLLASDGAFHFQGLAWQSNLASFPSGHTTSAFAAAVALGFMLPRWRWALLVAALLIGLSRILVGAHFPSDVVAGAALGTLATLVVAWSFANRGLAFGRSNGRIIMKPLRPRRSLSGPGH